MIVLDSAVPQSVPGFSVDRRLFRTAVFTCTVVVTTLLGLFLRLVMLNRVIGHIDEPASLLAAKRVAEIGYPRFPSGLLYQQGAVFSYLAAPLTWFFDDSALLHSARILYLCIAISVIPLTMILVHVVTESPFLALFAGILVACDPNLIFWGVTIRPYGMLASIVVAFLLLFVLLLKDGPGARLPVGRVVIWIPVLALLGTFTHIGFLICLPPLFLSAVIAWKSSLLTTHRPILIAGVLSLLPPLAFVALSRVQGGSGTGDGAVGRSIIGGHLFGFLKSNGSPDLRWSLWTDNFTEGALFAVMPSLIALASGVIIFAMLSLRPRTAEGQRVRDITHQITDQWKADAVSAVTFVHWFVIVAVTLLVVSDFEPRYLTQILPLGYAIISFAVWLLWQLAKERSAMTARLVQAGIVLILVVPPLLQTTTAANWRLDYPGGSPDYWQATDWASQRHEEGQAVITAMPPSTYFWFSEDRDDLIFLAGPDDSNRVKRYVRTNMNGEPGDYWLGLPSITSVEGLCSTLGEHAGNGWIIVDVGRLYSTWAFYGDFKTIIVGASSEELRGANGVLVYAIRSAENWSEDAKSRCAV